MAGIPMDEDEKTNNYQILLETEKYLREGGRITEDWIYEHTGHVKRYREYFTDFSKVNMEICDNEYRKLARQVENQLDTLYSFIQNMWSFDTELYYRFITNVIKLVNFTHAEIKMEEDLSDSLSKFCMNS
jgi:hypothetical protein